MPELQKIQDAFKNKKVKVVGIVADKKIDEAKNILNKIKITYLNLIPDKALEEQVVKYFDYVPATIFVNSKGEVLKTFIAGSNNFEKFKEIIEDILSG